MKKTPDRIGSKSEPGYRFRLAVLTGVLMIMAGCFMPSRSYLPGPQAPGKQNVPEKRPSSDPYEELGKRYVPLADATGFVQKGTASWYGGEFHGRRTASGEVYNKHAMTAAHTILPIGTYVKVINQENNRSVVVKVNDRGPFVKGRVIDLSYAAAQKLDMIKTGTAPVKIIALGDRPNVRPNAGPAEQPATPGAGSTTRPAGQSTARQSLQLQTSEDLCYVFQVGAFTSRENAERLKAELEQIYRNVHIVVYPEDGNVFYRVRLGSYDSREAIENDRQRMIEAGFSNVTVVTE